MPLSDDWMSMTRGGPRKSAYSEESDEETPTCEHCGKPQSKGWLERFKHEAAEMKRKRIDRATQ